MIVFYFLGAILALALIIFLTYKRLVLMMVKLFYSKYSYKYLRVYKGFYYTSPFGYCIRDDISQHLLPFVGPEKDLPVFKTKKHITFGNWDFYSKMSKIRKKQGKPICFNAFKLGKTHFRILGYRDMLANIPTRVLYFGLDNHFFMGEYVFKKIAENQKKFILESLEKKYLGEKVGTDKMFYIQESENRKIHFRDTGFSLIITYIDLAEQQTRESLNNVYQQLQDMGDQFKKEQAEEESIEL